MANIKDIEGIAEVQAGKLKEAGVTTTDNLLEKGATPSGRKALSEATGVSEKMILKWVNNADLYRIKGLGQEYSDLLETAGVDTVPELAQRKPDNLHKKIVEVNETKKLVRKVPTEKQVEEWVKQAGTLPRVIKY